MPLPIRDASLTPEGKFLLVNHTDEELAKLRAEIATLRLNLGESHPKVLELRKRIAEIERK